MARSKKKPPFVDGYLLKKVDDVRKSGKYAQIKTYSRRSTIVPKFEGITFAVYNGKKFVPVIVSAEMIGFKLGDFAPTRTFHGHGADKKAKK